MKVIFHNWANSNDYTKIRSPECSDNTPYEKVGKNDPISLIEKAPYEIPDNWEWCRVGDLFSNMSGLAYKKESLNVKSNSMIRVLRGGNIGDDSYAFKGDDVFISSEFVKPELFLKKNYMITPAVTSIEHIGKIALIEHNYGDTVVGGFVLMLLPIFQDDIISQYLLYAFSAKYHRDNCRSITHKSGQAFYNLSRELLMNLPIPIPPRDEMKRIIEKLKLIYPFVHEYEEKEKLLSALNATFPEQLKKSILQIAVQGKLVSQDSNDEPASVLLERIRKKKEQLIKEGKIKRDKNESIIFRRDNSHYEKLGFVERCIDDEIPVEIPDTWAWTRFSSVIMLQSGQDLSSDKYNSKKHGIPYITGASNIINENVVINRWTEYGRSFAKKGDLLISCKGTIGSMAFLKEDLVHIARQIMAIQPYDEIDTLYLKIVVESLVEQLKAKAKSMIPGISREDVLGALIPIPPLFEQKRITTRVNELNTIIESIQ